MTRNLFVDLYARYEQSNNNRESPMQPIADLLIDRKRLKSKLSGWRALALLAIFGASALFFSGTGKHASAIPGDYIAQISIEGVMFDDAKRDKLMQKIRDDTRVKAVIVRMDSPGGTTVSGEVVYLQLKEISAKKPVIGVMHTLCASACYMASLGTDHVIAREGTLTGSIGVLLQSMEMSRLADKLGIKPDKNGWGNFERLEIEGGLAER